MQYRKGVILSSLFVGIGGALIGAGVVTLRQWQEEESLDSSLDFDLVPPVGTILLFSFGAVAAFGGLIGAALSGSRLGARKRKLRRLQEAHYATPRRVQWDLARSRLVF
jgi:membrane associated rhomboid family serine protease